MASISLFIWLYCLLFTLLNKSIIYTSMCMTVIVIISGSACVKMYVDGAFWLLIKKH